MNTTHLMGTASGNKNRFPNRLMDGKRRDIVYSFEHCQICWPKIIALSMDGIILVRMHELRSVPDIRPNFVHVDYLKYVPQGSSGGRYTINHQIYRITEITM